MERFGGFVADYMVVTFFTKAATALSGGLDMNHMTFDYQFVTNPAYNRDSGPVSIIGTRLHAQI